LSRECNIQECPHKVNMHCHYIMETDDEGYKSWRSYGFCARHARELRAGQWEVAK